MILGVINPPPPDEDDSADEDRQRVHQEQFAIKKFESVKSGGVERAADQIGSRQNFAELWV